MRQAAKTIVGYSMCGQDDRATMYSDIESYDSVPQALLRNSSRVSHGSLCPKCRRKLDPSWIRPGFRVSNRRRDITCTYDGYTLVSERFRKTWRQWGHRGAVFLELPSDPQFFALESNQVVPFDAESAGTRFEDFCESCQSHSTVVGTFPTRLKGIAEALHPGLYRTDIAFACGIEQSPLLIVDPQTRMQIKSEKLVGFEFSPVEA